ncbi:MAG: DNA primase [Deinococcota bacterium]
MSQFSDSAKEQIRSRLDLVEVVGDVVALKPAGRARYKGLCPFHDEKTPSFHVLADKGFYYCFGCQAKGDVFDFVMETQHLGFAEALQMLGQQVGVEVAPPSPEEHKKRDLYEVNKLALEYFTHNLRSHSHAKNYLLGRALSEESINAFQLGFAPDSWDGLLTHLRQAGIAGDDMLAAGLLSESDGGRRYDRFRNRIMFPIFDVMGRAVGFSGRVLDDSLPKYMNTPETALFDKGALLYGLERAKTSIREQRSCIVVEGYMDVIALHQVGIDTAVAALGATLTEGQAQQLRRLEVDTVYLAFDADSAGQRATLSGLDQALGQQFLVKAVRVPHGKDPADTVLEHGPDVFLNALKDGLSEVNFRFETVMAKHNPNTRDGKRDILNELLPVLKPRDVFDPVASDMRRLVVDELDIDPKRLDGWLNSKRTRNLSSTQLRGLERPQLKHSRVTLIELEVMALLLSEPHALAERLPHVETALPPEIEDSLLLEFCAICHDCNYDDRAVLLRYRQRDEGRLVFERLFDESDEGEHTVDIAGHIQKSLARLRELYLEQAKEDQRKHLLARMQEVSRYLTDPNLPVGQLQQYYAELKEIQATLSAREAERQLRILGNFSKLKK